MDEHTQMTGKEGRREETQLQIVNSPLKRTQSLDGENFLQTYYLTLSVSVLVCNTWAKKVYYRFPLKPLGLWFSIMVIMVS